MSGHRHIGLVLALALCGAAASAFAAEKRAGPPDTAMTAVPPALAAATAGTNVETVYFADPKQPPVRLVRGPAPHMPAPQAGAGPAVARSALAHPVGPAAAGPGAARPQQATTQIVSFGTGFAEQVTVVRGMAPPLPSPKAPSGAKLERVAFADSRTPAVTVLRGPQLSELFSSDLFGPASEGELERIAFAVDGVESRHGADPRMWRPEPTGPQGPMQVSAAAALDVGGGNRFDLDENRVMGRAYLAQMFRRYGNWSDALAAYNWGPGNVDAWIAGGRPAEKLPLETARYIVRVMRDALITTAKKL